MASKAEETPTLIADVFEINVRNYTWYFPGVVGILAEVMKDLVIVAKEQSCRYILWGNQKYFVIGNNFGLKLG